MIEESNNRMSEGGSSAESLLSFLNTASSSVKNVLARPGCFKRNTNHRRFLQKQLRVTTQRTEPSSKRELSKKRFPLSKNKQRNSSRRKTEAVLTQLDQSAAPSRSNTPSRLSKDQFMLKRNLIDTNNLKRELQYIDECNRFSAMVDDLVDNLLDSSSPKETYQRNLPSANAESTAHLYARSGSVSSYSSSSEEELNLDFLSGEELVQSLDISELFIPEGHSSPVKERFVPQDESSMSNDFQMFSGDESPVHENIMHDANLIDVQCMPVFENVFRQFSL